MEIYSSKPIYFNQHKECFVYVASCVCWWYNFCFAVGRNKSIFFYDWWIAKRYIRSQKFIRYWEVLYHQKQLELEKEKQLLAQRAYDKIVARERQEQQRKQEAEEALIEEALRESKLYQTVLSIAWIQMFLIPIILIPCYLFSDEFNNNGWKDRISLIMVLAFLGVLLFVIISFFILDPIKNRIIKRIKENNIHNS